jgi:hypothetical protein
LSSRGGARAWFWVQTSELVRARPSEVAFAGGDVPSALNKAKAAGQARPHHLGLSKLQLTAAPNIDTPEPPSNTRHHVCPVSRPLHHEAAVAAALDEAARQLVLQRRRLQAARSEVRRPRYGCCVWRSGMWSYGYHCRVWIDGLTGNGVQGR